MSEEGKWAIMIAHMGAIMEYTAGRKSKREHSKDQAILSANKPAAARNKSGARHVFQLKDSAKGSAQNCELSFADIHRMEPLERIRLIRSGVEPTAFLSIVRSMHRSKESTGKMLGLSVTTVDRKLQKGQRLTADQSERLIATAKLIGQVQAMVEESGDSEGFDAARWFAAWLDKPLPGMGGHKPVELMSTAEGRELISRLLATAQSGAYV